MCMFLIYSLLQYVHNRMTRTSPVVCIILFSHNFWHRFLSFRWLYNVPWRTLIWNLALEGKSPNKVLHYGRQGEIPLVSLKLVGLCLVKGCHINMILSWIYSGQALQYSSQPLKCLWSKKKCCHLFERLFKVKRMAFTLLQYLFCFRDIYVFVGEVMT